MSAIPNDVVELHPSLWRASQLARVSGRVVPTGHDRLSRELPGGGWPVGALTELLVQRPGMGELRLLQPALNAVAGRPVMFVDPPHTPNALGLSYIGVPLDNVMWLKPGNTADALWTTEQILKANTCGALLLWQGHMRPDSLRRLTLHAQACESLFFIVRPLAVQPDASPATLRLALRPAADGINVDIVKRKGPLGVDPFDLTLTPSPILLSSRGRAPRPLQKVRGVPSPQPLTVE